MMDSFTNPSVSYERYILVVRERDELRERLSRVNNLVFAIYEQSRESHSEEKEELAAILRLLEGK